MVKNDQTPDNGVLLSPRRGIELQSVLVHYQETFEDI